MTGEGAALPDGVLTCEDPAGPSILHFSYQDQCCEAVVIRVVEHGMLICIPKGGIDPQLFEAAEEEGYPGMIGPFTEVAVGVHRGRSRRTVDCVIFDIDAFDLSCLSVERPEFFDEGAVTSFGVYRGTADYPAKTQLLELANNFVSAGGARLDQYFSAMEEEVAPANSGRASGAEDPGQLLQKLLAQAEVTQRTVTGMNDKLQTISHLEARLDLLEAAGAMQASTARGPQAPQVFNVASPKLSDARVGHLRSLAGRGPGRLGDIGDNGKGSAATALGGITKEAEPVDIDGEPLTPEGNGTLEKLLTSQTALLQQLVAAKTQQSDPLTMLSSSGGLDSEEMPKSSGVRGIAARQLLTESFRRHPLKVVSVFKERLMLARRKGSLKELEPRDLWYDFQDQVPLGSHRALTHMSFIAAAMYEAMEQGDIDRLKMIQDARGDASRVHRTSLLRRRRTSDGSFVDGVGGSSILANRTASISEPLVSPRATGRPEVGGCKPSLPEGFGRNHREEQQVCSSSRKGQDASHDDKEAPKRAARPKKKGGRKGNPEATEEEG